ncbi:MAG: hypothetical protein ACI9KN_002571 [Gammaproteobacteria bacterium]|jgi:hypothetical protein
MPVTLGVNNLSVVHKSSNGISVAFPDVCKTPSPAVPIPIPYPNIAMSSGTAKGTTSVKVDGNPVCVKDSIFKTSTGDEAGSAGGVISGKTKGKAEFVNFSFDVKFDGKNVARALDLMLHNDKNTPPFPVMNDDWRSFLSDLKAKFENVYKDSFIEFEVVAETSTLVDEPHTPTSNTFNHLYNSTPALANRPFHLRLVVLNNISEAENNNYLINSGDDERVNDAGSECHFSDYRPAPGAG